MIHPLTTQLIVKDTVTMPQGTGNNAATGNNAEGGRPGAGAGAGKGPGDAGGWPSTNQNPSGKGRSNNPPAK